MHKKDYMTPSLKIIHLRAKQTFLQTSSTQPTSLRYGGDDDGEGEGD
jgi:hypothetical protein